MRIHSKRSSFKPIPDPYFNFLLWLMHFVGREKETKKIIKALERGENVIITGKYGIGKTSLVRHVKDISRNRWTFAFSDFSFMPGDISRQLLSQLSPQKERSQNNQISSKSGRYLLAQLVQKNEKQVIVLDNIAKLTYQKLALIRYLGEAKKFQFIALVESSLPDNDLLRLRAELMPSHVINLSYLGKRSTRELLQCLSDKYALGLTAPQISSLVSIARGYPLGVKELAMKQRKQSVS